MADYEINDLGGIGLVVDRPEYMLPPEAWGLAENMRFIDRAAHRLKGWPQVFGTPGVAPHFAMNVVDSNQSWWLYTSLTKGYVYDGTSHVNITRQSGGSDVDYTAALTEDWGGTILGGIPILNNGADVPQFWASYNTSTKLADMTNWPSTLLAKTVVAYGPHLFALNCTKSGIESPHMVKWSHPADPGSLPISWDETDATKDAGEYELPDSIAGLLLTGLTLRGQLFAYKEGAVWRIRFIGGRAVFAFDSFIDSTGLVGRRAVCSTPDGSAHVCLMQDDVIMHNGQSARSLLNEKLRRDVFNRISSDSKKTSFCIPNLEHNEVWICFPESGNSYPNRALIWNATRDVISEVKGVDFRGAAIGQGPPQDSTTWGTVSGSWDSVSRTWGLSTPRRVIICDPDNTRFGMLDSGAQRFGGSYTSRMRREGLAILGKTRTGEPIVDFKRFKLFTRVWIKAEGDPFKVRLGTQELVEGSVSWSAEQIFDPSTDLFLDFVESGRAVAVEFSSHEDGLFEVQGYKPEVVPLGNF